MKVSNLTNKRGNKVAKQFYIEDGVNSYFQSYETIIAMRDGRGKITIDSNAWNYSRATSKYLSIFLNMSRKECEHLVSTNEIKVANLNK